MTHAETVNKLLNPPENANQIFKTHSVDCNEEIKREIRIRRGDIDGLMININIDFEDLLKKMKKIIDEESN